MARVQHVKCAKLWVLFEKCIRAHETERMLKTFEDASEIFVYIKTYKGPVIDQCQ